MLIDVINSPGSKAALSGKFDVIVIDVLRASATIITALKNCASGVIPAGSVREAAALRKNFPKGKVLLGGERKGRKVRGFDLGNSPFEYTKKKVEGRVLILATSNGTKAVGRFKARHNVYIGTFRNLSSLAEYLLKRKRNIVIACSGRQGARSLEDTVCAGMFVSRYLKSRPAFLSPGAADALMLYASYRGKTARLASDSPHAVYLKSLGFDRDIPYCLKTDCDGIIPRYDRRSGLITAVPEPDVKK